MRMGDLLEALFLSEGAGAYLVWGLIRERECSTLEVSTWYCIY